MYEADPPPSAGALHYCGTKMLVFSHKKSAPALAQTHDMQTCVCPTSVRGTGDSRYPNGIAQTQSAQAQGHGNRSHPGALSNWREIHGANALTAAGKVFENRAAMQAHPAPAPSPCQPFSQMLALAAAATPAVARAPGARAPASCAPAVGAPAAAAPAPAPTA